MPTLKEFRKSAASSVLILGVPGSGKTSLAVQLGKNPYIVDLDNNIGSALEYLAAKNIEVNGVFDTPQKDDKNQPIPRSQRWLNMNKLLGEKLKSGKHDVVVIDSMTALNAIVIDEIRRQAKIAIAGENKAETDAPLQIQHWGLFGGLIREWFILLRAYGVTLVVTGHTNVEKEALDESVKRLFINVPGKFADEIAGLFSEVWMCSCEEVKDADRNVSYKYYIKTRPSRDMIHLGLKSARQLSPKELVDPVKFNKLLFPLA